MHSNSSCCVMVGEIGLVKYPVMMRWFLLILVLCWCWLDTKNEDPNHQFAWTLPSTNAPTAWDSNVCSICGTMWTLPCIVHICDDWLKTCRVVEAVNWGYPHYIYANHNFVPPGIYYCHVVDYLYINQEKPCPWITPSDITIFPVTFISIKFFSWHLLFLYQRINLCNPTMTLSSSVKRTEESINKMKVVSLV